MGRKISIELLVDESDLVRGFKRSSHAAKDFNRDIDRSFRGALAGAGAFKSLGRSVAFASTAFLGGAGLTAVLKSSVEGVAALDDQVSRSRVTFRSAAGEVRAFSKTTANVLGIAETDALAAANSFGALLTQLGYTRREASGMSTRLVTLAGDLSALTGKPQEEVFAALRSGIAGNTRGLKQLQIVVDNASIKQEAYRLGLVKQVVTTAKVRQAQQRLSIAQFEYDRALKKHKPNSVEAARAALQLDQAQTSLKNATAGATGALSANAKAAAIYSLIMKRTVDANGAAARSSGSLSQQQKILHAQVRNIQNEIGAVLTPQILRVTTATTEWLGKSENQARVQRDLREATQDVSAVVQASLPVLQASATQIRNNIRGLESLAQGFRDTKASIPPLLSDMFLLTAALNGIPRSIGINIHIGGTTGLIKKAAALASGPGLFLANPYRGGGKGGPAPKAGPAFWDRYNTALWQMNTGGAGGYGYATGGEVTQTGARRRASMSSAAQTALTHLTGGGGGGGGSSVDTAMARLNILLTRAQQTPGLRDDLQILNKEKQLLQKRLRANKGNLEIQQQLADVEGQIASTVTQERDRLRGLVGGLFQGPLLAPSDEDIKRKLGFKGPSIGTLTGDLRAQNQRFAAERRDINRLRRRGASDRLIGELEGLGIEGAGQVHSLATASDKALKAFFKQFQLREKLVANAVRMEVTANVVNLRAGRISQVHHQARTAQQHRANASQGGVVQHNTINIHDARNSAQVARNTAGHLQRQAKSTTVQRRGRSPGVSGASF